MESICGGEAAAEDQIAAGSWVLDAMQPALGILWLAGWRCTLTGEEAGPSKSSWVLHQQVCCASTHPGSTGLQQHLPVTKQMLFKTRSHVSQK